MTTQNLIETVKIFSYRTYFSVPLLVKIKQNLEIYKLHMESFDIILIKVGNRR